MALEVENRDVGVSQGSGFGPISFLLSINDLLENTYSQVGLFADDNAVYMTVNSISDSEAGAPNA